MCKRNGFQDKPPEYQIPVPAAWTSNRRRWSHSVGTLFHASYEYVSSSSPSHWTTPNQAANSSVSLPAQFKRLLVLLLPRRPLLLRVIRSLAQAPQQRIDCPGWSMCLADLALVQINRRITASQISCLKRASRFLPLDHVSVQPGGSSALREDRPDGSTALESTETCD